MRIVALTKGLSMMQEAYTYVHIVACWSVRYLDTWLSMFASSMTQFYT